LARYSVCHLWLALIGIFSIALNKAPISNLSIAIAQNLSPQVGSGNCPEYLGCANYY
jgi:hypothetical protein